MSALAKADYAPWSLSEAVVADLARKGAHVFDERLDPGACAALLAEIRSARRFDESLFLSEADFQAPQPANAPGPRHGGDLLEWLDCRLGFVERAPRVVEALWSLLGPDYRILDRRLVCALPDRRIPDWVKRRARGASVEDLGPYVRPELRDMSYAWDAEIRQDLIDEPGLGHDVVTLEIWLNPVTEADAPRVLLEGSHRMGRAVFPCDLKRTGPDRWRYRNGAHGEMYLTQRALTGEAGGAALWHACTLNGAPPAAEHERISLRYLIVRGEAKTAGIDAVNASLGGGLGLAS